ncbi:MAG TPA: hypothetical protein DEB39_04930 [Planctomycetaceae bacterium]|nr:hypothetical protein [Planctomycetaceae bacterium]
MFTRAKSFLKKMLPRKAIEAARRLFHPAWWKQTVFRIDSIREDTVFSYDVFDTLITRDTGTPNGIFAILRYRLRNEFADRFDASLIEDFFFLRTRAPRHARQCLGREETSLFEIYEAMSALLPVPLSPEQVRFLAELEVETELDHIRPVPEMIAEVEKLLEQKRRVVLVSDIYLPSETVAAMLVKCAPVIAASCELFCSSDVMLTKRSGKLFRHVCRRLGIPLSRLRHRGDDPISDSLVPESLGVTVEKTFKGAVIGDYEKGYLDSPEKEESVYRQLCAGTARSFRVNHPDAGPAERVGACFTGPMLYGFVEETLAHAAGEGIETLFFLARDGRILLRIADAINNVHALGLKLRYLYCARQACRRAALFHITPREIGWFSAHPLDRSIRELGLKCGVDAERFRELLPPKIREKIASVHATLPHTLFRDILDVLQHDGELKSVVLENAAGFRRRFLEYLEQEGFFSHSQTGIVDLGWQGKMQDTLYTVVTHHRPGHRLSGYYFGLTEMSPATNRSNRKECYLFSPRFHPHRLEALTRADHGATVDYRRDTNGRIGPVFSEGDYGGWPFEEYGNAVARFAADFARQKSRYPGIVADDRGIVFEGLLPFLDRPNREFAQAVGDVPFSPDQNDLGLKPLAPPLGIGEIVRHILFRKKTRLTYWPEISIKRSGPGARLVMTLALAWRSCRSKSKTIFDAVKNIFR